MPHGDVGGSASQLIITCIADCQISKGDPVCFLENYKVRNYLGNLFGQAMENVKEGHNFAVMVKGLVRFNKANFSVSSSTVHHRFWRISQNGPVLVPMLMGCELQVMFMNEDRLDVLL